MTTRIKTAIFALFTLSGMCALIYELVWTRWLGLLVGNFPTAAATVIAVFMAGLALGNWIAGPIAAKRSPAGALKLYAMLEGGLAVLAALSVVVFSSSSPWFPWLAAASDQPLVRALICFALLLPPTILMGGTFPALVRTLSATAPRALGAVYAFNTLGGAAGPLLAAFVLMPGFGITATLWVACAINASVAAAAYAVSRRIPPEASSLESEVSSPPKQEAAATPSPRGAELPAWVPYLLAGFSGFLALGFEIALTRMFVLTITGGSVYGFAVILSSYLIGIAAGAALVRRWPPRDSSAALFAFAVAQGIVWLFALTTPFWDLMPVLLVRVWWAKPPFALLMLLDFAVILSMTLVLTTAFGYTLPALSAALPRATSATIGRLFAANTLGAVAGPIVTAFVLLRYRGLTETFLILGLLALAAATTAAAVSRPRHRIEILIPAPFLVAISILIVLFFPPDISVLNAGMYNRPHGFQPGREQGGVTPVEAAYRLGKIIYQKDSLTARVSVRAVSPEAMSFVVNGKPDGSTSLVDMYTQIFMGHIPLLTHPDPRKVLVIGLGTGTTTGCMTLHDELQVIHVAEIEPAQIDVARIFGQHNYRAVDHHKVRIHLDDARHFLLVNDETYDVIVSEPSNLWVSGMVNLFTREFYASVSEHLGPEGVFFQWIHYYRVADEDVKGMFRTFQSVFPHATLWIHQFGDAFLMARKDGMAIDFEDWVRRLDRPVYERDLKRIQISPPIEMLSFYLFGPGDLERFSEGGRICTDDFPYLEFTSPRVRYVASKVQAMRTGMQIYGPVDPVPLARETAAVRVKLGDMFLARGSIARAKAEYSQAVRLDPRPAGARKKLARMEEIERTSYTIDARTPAAQYSHEEE